MEQHTQCIFCKIAQGMIASKKVKETEHLIVINDIAPKAPTHYLIIPKKHIESMAALTEQDMEILKDMGLMVKALGNEVPSKAFNIISNNGAAAGQSVMHLHWHFLSGKNIYDQSFSL